MKIKISFAVLLAIAVCVLTFVGVYFTRIRTMSSIRQHTRYDDGYNLYSMNVSYDYSIQNVIDSGFTDTQGYLNAVIRESLPFLPVKMELPVFACSAYRAQNTDGESIMGRNYDFKYNTSCLMVYCTPKDGYRSVAGVALNNLEADDATGSLSGRFACLTAPFSCLDGINEKGVSIAILTLDSEPTDQNTGKEKITASLAVRMVLDYAATTQEAVDLLSRYDMLAVNGRDYHLFISDASGDSRVLEYDPEVPERTLTVTPIPAITNFYGFCIDKVLPGQKNGIYGHGKERYEYIMDILEPNQFVLTGEQAWDALKAASTEPNHESVTSNTQWSIIFNNTKPNADIILRRKWGDMHSFPVMFSDR